MIRRLIILGLGSGLFVGLRIERAARKLAAPIRSKSRCGGQRRTDWQAEGTQGAVAAGGREAVAAGLES